MSKTETRTVETAYGSVDVELAECDSCGNEVRADETVEFTIGDREGVACEYCQEEGPMSFPEKFGMGNDHALLIPFVAAFSPLVVATMVLLWAEPDTDNDGTLTIDLGIFLGGWLWGVLIAMVVFEPFGSAVLGALPL